MSMMLTEASTNVGDLFGRYTLAAGAFDEMFSAPGVVRPHWQKFAATINQLGGAELVRRTEQARRLVHENGITYSAYGDVKDASRPWNLDLFPLIIDAEQWRTLSAGLMQRARLLNKVLADLYDEQTLLKDGLIPASLLYQHPGFDRAFHGQRLPNDCYLHFYVADLARSPDGNWWVVADRVDAPLGAGYAVENRIVASRIFQNLFRELQVARLAPFFLAVREMLQNLAPQHRDNPRIVLLSQGPGNPNYFEDAYLARYLGYTLVEGGDLAVRNDRVMLKTLAGLQQVDVIFRRMSDQHCDPLELRSDPALGVPGLLQAARLGNVAIANGLGAGLIESAAFMAYLPRLCQSLLGQELQLPSAATWWCGETAGQQQVLANLDRLMVRSAFRTDRQEVVHRNKLAGLDNTALARRIQANPALYVGQERIPRSTAPVWTGTTTQQAHVALRVFLVANGDSYLAMPGGLVRVSASADSLDRSILAGEGSKDLWVQSTGPVRNVSLLQSPGEQMELRRTGADMPSRVADDLFWLGRHAERAEGSARLLRTLATRLASEGDAVTLRELPVLLHTLASQGQIEPGYAVDGIREQLPPIDQALPAAAFDATQAGSLRSTLTALYRVASIVRDRLAIDAWRIVNRIDFALQQCLQNDDVSLSDLLSMLNQILIELAAFAGLVMESMTRTQGWRFLDLGRRLERSLHTIALVQSTLIPRGEVEPAMLEAVLEVADSAMTYRSRYLANLQLTPLLDLLLTDDTNPRSLVFQLVALVDHVENLPRDRSQPLHGPEQRIAMSSLNSVRMIDLEMLSGDRKGAEKRGGERSKLDGVLGRLAELLPKLSDLISHKYLIHAGTPRQLAEFRNEGQSARLGDGP